MTIIIFKIVNRRIFLLSLPLFNDHYWIYNTIDFLSLSRLKENEITQTNYYSLSTTRIQPSFNDNMSNNFTIAHDLLVDKFQLNFHHLKEKEDRLAIGDNLFY